jgi:hypothetical protein
MLPSRGVESTQPIQINPNWQGKVREWGEKFNKYVARHSASLISDLIEELLKLLDSPKVDSVYRFDIAQLLQEIRDHNEGIIMWHYSQKIDKILWGDGSPPEKSPPLVKIPQNTDSTVPENPDIWTEKDLEGEKPKSPATAPSPEELMLVPVESLQLKNVTKIPMKPDFAKRTCALGDGLFEDYEGNLWECKCGTLYHPECLKVQALFVGKCHICDRPFRNVK